MAEPFPAFVDIADTPYGPMLYPKEDKYVGRSFKEYGQFSAGELSLFLERIRPGSVVLDVGANIGAHTVPLAQHVGAAGQVIAFEPQRILHQMLCGNLALNGVPNVVTHAVALSDAPGTCLIPLLDYGSAANFGGLPMDLATEGETVTVATLDQFHLPRVDFIKLDVEGFERKVLLGAAETLGRCRPELYVENDREDRSADLIQTLLDLGYRLWWHTPPLFRSPNFKNNPVNVFPGIVSINMLAVHRERPGSVEGLAEITSPAARWQDHARA